jgi:uncharacterized membrane protein
MELKAATTVRKAPSEVYAFWRRFDNFPAFMTHVDEVRATSDTRSHWRAEAPGDKTVEWDAEIIQDEPNETIAWRSVEGADVSNEGSVRFIPAPGDQGTEVHLALSYDMPAGKAGEVLARLAGEDPHQQIDDDLRRFKQVMETGEVVRSDGAPGGKQARHEFPQHAAQPLNDQELAEVLS